MRFTAVGDILIQRRIPTGCHGIEEISNIIRESDAGFFNLETTINYEGECFASQFSGGTYVRTNPEVLEDIKSLGFNMVNCNNNHAMDFSYEGLRKTMHYIKKSGFVYAGIGENLAEASAPRYLETKKGRVALISVNSTFNPAMLAGEQTNRVKGRPGINGLRFTERYTVPKNTLEFLKTVAEKTTLNAEREIEISQGYLLPDKGGCLNFGGILFEAGDEYKKNSYAEPRDLERIKRSIYEAQLQSDYIIISMHCHEVNGTDETMPPEFLKEFAHFCIDSGANAFIGHGTHQLRPIEVYRDCPIFYSLGDFFLQLYDVEFAPEEFYNKYGLTAASSNIHELLKKRSKNFSIGLMEQDVMLETVIPVWETENTVLKELRLVPVRLKKGGKKTEEGLPEICSPDKICDRINRLSNHYGVNAVVEDDKIICSW